MAILYMNVIHSNSPHTHHLLASSSPCQSSHPPTNPFSTIMSIWFRISLFSDPLILTKALFRSIVLELGAQWAQQWVHS